MKTSRPKRSRFCGSDYKIQYDALVISPDGDKCLGLTLHDDKEIRMLDGMRPHLDSEVLLHEVFHQIFAHSALGYPPEEEERLVEFLGKAVTGHMRENPSLWTYIKQQARTKDNNEQSTKST